jgi:hypothetical protein
MSFKENYSQLIIRSVIVFYSVWLSVLVFDLISCTFKNSNTCDQQRSELRGAATAIPATLLAWLADSPIKSGP